MIFSARIVDMKRSGSNLALYVPPQVRFASKKVRDAEWVAVGYQPRSPTGKRLVVAIGRDDFEDLARGVNWLHVSRWLEATKKMRRVYLPKRPYLHAGIELKPGRYVAECHHRRLYGGWVLFLNLTQSVASHHSAPSAGFTAT